MKISLNVWNAYKSNELPVVKTVKEGLNLIEKGVSPVVIGRRWNPSEDYDICPCRPLGYLFEDRFVFDWPSECLAFDGHAVNEKDQHWIDMYTINMHDKEAWERLCTVSEAFAVTNYEDLGYNNWLDMSKTIKTGIYDYGYFNSRNYIYTVTDEVLYNAQDIHKSFDQIKEEVIAKYPEIATYKGPNTWECYNDYTAVILAAYEDDLLDWPWELIKVKSEDGNISEYWHCKGEEIKSGYTII